jgi:hypothetical protein
MYRTMPTLSRRQIVLIVLLVLLALMLFGSLLGG